MTDGQLHLDGAHRTRATLADGREILYYDEAAGDRHAVSDPRPLSTIVSTSELRTDPLTGDRVVIAGHRQTRTFKPPTDLCPLCPSVAGRPTEIPDDHYDVVVFENRFPSLHDRAAPPGELDGAPPFQPGRGRCEVVCFCAEHDSSLASLPTRRVRTVVEALADRTQELSSHPDVAQVFPFENRGEDIGVTLHHPHGQIYAYPFVPPKVQAKLDQAARHREATGRDLFADLLDDERRAGSRVVVTGEAWIGFTPPAARWPYELLLVPRRHVPDLPALSSAERDELAVLLPRVLGGFERLFPGPASYIAAWHQAPVHQGRDLLRLHLEVFTLRRTADKLKYLAGSESAAGVWINDVAPEQAAARLREVIG
ncbi:galactose-1-phosphate uridylyltransferase [Nitriliruptoraceae bacterium ZYF776]|nr:galactose-1-phosphate uridylyltransferase [Profundirhabdus halotolerans]